MKLKQLLTTLVICIFFAFNGYSQDTVYLNGTNKVTFSLGITVSSYWVNCTNTYAPASTTLRSLTSIGKFLVKSNGTGYIIPKAGYSGTWKFYSPNCGLVERTVVFMTQPSGGGGGGTPAPTVFSYQWKSGIGNTGDSVWGPKKFKGLRAPTAVCELNGYLYATTGFVEGNGPAFKTLISNPKIKIEIGGSPNGYDNVLEGTWIVSDASKVYILGFDPYGYTVNGGSGYSSKIDCAIVAYDINDNLATFSAGESFSCTLQDIPYASGIVITRDDSTQRPVRLELDNTYLYVYTRDSVKRFNKTTGARVSAEAYTPTPGVLSTFTRNGVTATMTTTSVTYNGTTLATAFNSPAITNYKYVPRDFNFHLNSGCIYIGSDNTFWLVDRGNSRILHYTSNGTYLNQIAYVPMNYNCSVDRNNPTRVFAGFLEYQISYPSLTWTLVNNWTYGLNEKYRPRSFYENSVNVMRNVVTVGGITYALMDSVILYEGYGLAYPSKMRLTSSGVVRTKVYDAYENVWFDLNGDEYIAICDNQLGSRNILYKNGVQVEQSPIITDSSASYLDDANFAVTTDGYYVVFNNMNNAKNNYHIEWIKNGVVTNKGAKSITGTQTVYPTTDRFIVDGVGGLPASKKVSICDSITVFMYSGEGFQNAQVTKLHIYKGRRFYQIIGKTYAEAVTASGGETETPKEYAGNAFEGDLVKVNGKYYYFFNDEHGGSLQCFVITIP